MRNNIKCELFAPQGLRVHNSNTISYYCCCLTQVVYPPCRNKLSVKNVPAEMSDESLKETLTQYGTLKDFTRKNDSVHIAYSTLEEAQE